MTKKKSGWGTVSQPTSNGSRRVQFSLTHGDVLALREVIAWKGSRGDIDGVRACLVAAVEAGAANPGRFDRLVSGAKLARGKASAGNKNQRELLSHWLRKDDLERIAAIMAGRGFRSMSEAIRFAVRVTRGLKPKGGACAVARPDASTD